MKNTTKYFKVIKGFRSDEFIPIDETELDKAIYAHMTGKVVAFNNGSINGSSINSVMPDWHKSMGWNYAHVMQVEDWDEIRSKGIEKSYQGVIGEAKEKVQYLMQTNQLHLLGKPVPELSKTNITELKAVDTSLLAKGMKI